MAEGRRELAHGGSRWIQQIHCSPGSSPDSQVLIDHARASSGDVSGWLQSLGSKFSDFIIVLLWLGKASARTLDSAFKNVHKSAYHRKYADAIVAGCACRHLDARKRCPGFVCHTKPQTAQSKDYFAGDCWSMGYYNIVDACKCFSHMSDLMKNAHGSTELPLMLMRVASLDADSRAGGARVPTDAPSPCSHCRSFHCMGAFNISEREAPGTG